MSNAFRDFTVIRRRSGLIDLLTPKRSNVKGYRIQASSNFDGTFTTLMTADIGSGYLDPALNSVVLHSVNNPNQIRIAFNPTTFAVPATIADDQHIWLRFVPVDFAGSAGTPGAPGLILPDDEHKAAGRVVIQGTAPNAAAGSALRLDLPFRMKDFRIRNNEGTTGLFVSTAVGGSEVTVPAGQTITWEHGAQSSLFVRGGSGTAAFSADFTHYLPL